MIRAFFGISLTPKVIQQLMRDFASLQRTLQGNAQPIDSALLHITVKFLNTIDARSLAMLADIANDIAATSSPFELQLKKITSFPRVGPKVIAAYLVPHPELLRLHTELDESAEKVGIVSESRRYRPHITLGKLKSIPSYVETIECLDVTIPVTELVLYESKPGPEGSRYIPLRRFKLLK